MRIVLSQDAETIYLPPGLKTAEQTMALCPSRGLPICFRVWTSQIRIVLSWDAETMRLLRQRLDEPFVTVNSVTGDIGMKQAQDEYAKLIRNKTPKSRR